MIVRMSNRRGSVTVAGATLSAIADPEIKRLCARIIESQQAEIEQMQAILNRY